ncbi:MAG: UvrD-helicase domain-containing protein, partial [Candidatus Kapaibacterium sp.]
MADATDGKQKQLDFLQGTAVACRAFLAKADTDTDAGYAYRMVASITEITEKKVTKNGMSEAAKAVVDSLTKLEDVTTKIGSDAEAADRRMVNHARTLVEMAVEVVSVSDERKREIRQLGFDDLQREALRVVQSEEVCRELRSQMKCVMMDEFQDTNDVQFDLLKRLVPQPAEGEEATSDITVFLVGDVKQSIYGFRNADVRVFEKAKAYVHDLNRCRHGAGVQGHVHLSASYRMAADVADTVNVLCADAFASDAGEFDVAYDPLVCARNASTFPVSHCELLLGRGKNPFAKEEPTQPEVRQEHLVTDAIRRMVDGADLTVYDDKHKVLRRAVYRDIAILSRTGRSLARIESALMRSGIPYMRHSGTGFYSTQEVRDALSFLAFVLDPTDDAALVAVLRSPMFAVAERTIAAEKSIKDGHELWYTLRARYLKQDVSGLESDMRSAVVILDSLVSSAPVTSPSDLLRDVLLTSAWYARVDYLEHRAEQARRNMEKLIAETVSIESAGFRHLHEVVRELRMRMTTEAGEAEAAVLSGENVVNLMTVHASKGLEFPIVIIVDLGNKGRAVTADILIHEDAGVCFTLHSKFKNGRQGVMRYLAEDRE